MTANGLAARVVLVVMMALPGVALCQPRSEAGVTYVTRDGGPGPTELKMNIVVPEGPAAKRACIVCIHGGGWAGGRRQDLDGLAKQLASQGFVAATVSYRFAPANVFPAQILDCSEAVRFLRTNADRYGIDPDRIGAVGFSAGGHLAMLLGVGDAGDGLGIEGGEGKPSAKVQAVVSFFGPTKLGTNDYGQRSKNILVDFLGGTPEERPEAYRAASPVSFVGKGDAPVLLFQGTADDLVPASQATLMIEAMGKAGVRGRAELLAGAGHGWGGPELARTLKEAVEFFRQELKASGDTRTAEPAGAVFTVNSDEAPDLAEWGERAKKVCEEWYPRLIKEYASEGFRPRETVNIVFKKQMRVPAATGGGTISVNADYVRGHTDDMGMMVHELFHVVQAYPRQKGDVGWLTEGLADYVRFWQYEPQTRQRPIDKENASYRNSYRVTAAFIGWLEKKSPGAAVKLNARMRAGNNDQTIFKEVVGTDVDTLWKEFVDAGAPSSPAAQGLIQP